MPTSAFYNPKSVSELVDLLAKHKADACIVNGGTDIVEKIGNRSLSPGAIVYIKNIKELDYIEERDGHVCIGGIASYKSVLESKLCAQFNGLLQAVAEIGSPPIRVVGTPAGNVATAAPAADCNVALLALDASLILSSQSGERCMAASEIFTGAWKTAITPGEFIREIRIPTHQGGNSTFIKLAKRKAQDISQVSTCVYVKTAGNICQTVRVALGAAASRPIRVPSFENLVLQKPLEEALAALRNLVPAEISLRNPRNKAYKEMVISVIVGRALKMAWT